MEPKLICSSCKKSISNETGTAKFNCPACGKHEIVRCKDCRKVSAKYKCPVCSFSGPN